MDTAYSTTFPLKNRVAGRARIAIDDETSVRPKKFRNLASA